MSYSLDAMLGELANIRDHYSQFPFVRRMALKYGAPKTNDDTDTMLANLFEFVKRNVTYVPDPDGYELVTAPDVMLADIIQGGTAHGDCDDHALLLNTLLMAIGFQTRFAAVSLGDDPNEFDHVIAVVCVHGEWKDYDACAKNKPQPSYPVRYYGGQ